jgi:hypothetical protein
MHRRVAHAATHAFVRVDGQVEEAPEDDLEKPWMIGIARDGHG